jgi:asparagine N-glycosylation enzyme membrane subunit Stt3
MSFRLRRLKVNIMNESEWRDVNPATADLPNKGRTVIIYIVAGIVLGVLAFLGTRIRPVGLAAGGFALVTGIGIFLRRQKARFKEGIALTVAGFLMLLANPRFGVVAGFAVYFLIVGAIGLVVLGIFKAIKLSWDLGKRS